MLLPGKGGGVALKAEGLSRAAKAARAEGLNLPFIGGSGGIFKIYVSVNAFQAILKPIFPYSITSTYYYYLC